MVAKKAASKRHNVTKSATAKEQPATKRKVGVISSLKEAFVSTKKKVVKVVKENASVNTSAEPEGISIEDIPDAANFVEEEEDTPAQKNTPHGKAKSGRNWKVKEKSRHSTMHRQGTVSNLSKSQARHEADRARKKQVKELEMEMKAEKKQKALDAKERREEQNKRRLANQMKTASTQNINPEKIKGMSKKQLKNIRKTAIGKNGQVELIPAYR